MNIKNLKPLREKLKFSTHTNVIDIDNNFDEITERVLMSFESGEVGIDAFQKNISREISPETGRKEASEFYYKRVHQLIGREITSLTNGREDINVKYEVFQVPKTEKFIVFFISPSLKVDEDSINDVLDFIDEITSTLEEKHKRRLVQSLLSLIAKAAIYEHYCLSERLCAEFFNSELLLSPITSGTKKVYVNALRPSFFFSEQNEFIFNLIVSNYELSRVNDISNSTELIGSSLNCFMMHKDTKMQFVKKVRATKVKRHFYATAEAFGECKLLAYSFMNNIIQRKFAEIGLGFTPRMFTPTFEVDSFSRLENGFEADLNPIYLVDTKNNIAQATEGYDLYLKLLVQKFNVKKVISTDDYFEIIKESNQSLNFIFANGSEDDEGTIEYFNNESLSKNDNEKKFLPSFNSTFQALAQKLKDSKKTIKSSFDIYTEIKLELLEKNMRGEPSIHCHQGFNIKSGDCSVLVNFKDYVFNEKQRLSLDRMALAKLNGALNSVDAKVSKIKTEIYLKQSIFSKTPIKLNKTIGEFPCNGHYYVDFFKHTKEQDNEEYFHSKLEIFFINGEFTVRDVKVRRCIRDLINQESPYLKTVNKIYNESYFIHCIDSNETLTSYNSIRVPLSLGNTLRDLAFDWEKVNESTNITSMFGRSNGATKSGKESCALPFYITAGRSTRDQLTDDSKKHHYLILEPNDNECLVFVTDANFPKKTITKQILCKNIICWDSNGESLSWNKSTLFDFYLSCHTYDIVKLNETAKTSLVTKLASIALVN